MKNSKTLLWTAGLMVLSFLIAACTEGAMPPGRITNYEECVKAGNPVMESDPAQCRTPDGETFVQEVIVTSGDEPAPGGIHNLPVPPAVEKVKEHAATLLGTEKNKVLVLEAQEREWPDGCLGIAEPGIGCDMVITPGYWVKVRAMQQELMFRTNAEGTVIKQE